MAASLSILCIASYHKGHDFLREAKRQGAPRLPGDLREPARRRLAAREPRRHLLRAGRREALEARRPDPRRQPPGAARRHRPHRAARRLRSREGVVAARAPARAGHGRDDDPLLPRQAGDAPARRRGRRARAGVRARAERRRDARLLRRRAGARGCSSRGSRPAPSASRRWPARPSCGRSSTALGDRASFHLLEQFVPGDVYHVDSVVYEREVAGGGGQPLRRGRPSTCRTAAACSRRSWSNAAPAEDRALQAVNRAVLTALGLVRGVSHTEFIRGDDGQWYFLETVGAGRRRAHRGAGRGGHRHEPVGGVGEGGDGRRQGAVRARRRCAATTPAWSRRWPGRSGPTWPAFADPEVVWRLSKRHHAGLIVASPRRERVAELVDAYARRLADDYSTYLPPGDAPRD